MENNIIGNIEHTSMLYGIIKTTLLQSKVGFHSCYESVFEVNK